MFFFFFHFIFVCIFSIFHYHVFSSCSFHFSCFSLVSIPTFHRTHEAQFGGFTCHDAKHHRRGQVHQHVRSSHAQGWRSATESSWTLWHTGGPDKDTHGTPVPQRRGAVGGPRHASSDTIKTTRPRFTAPRLGYQHGSGSWFVGTPYLRSSDRAGRQEDLDRQTFQNTGFPICGRSFFRLSMFYIISFSFIFFF